MATVEPKLSKSRKIVFFALMGLGAGLLIGLLIYLAISHNTRIIASGVCGDSASWELTESGRLTVSGSGRMNDCSGDSDDTSHFTNAPWARYAGSVKKIVISEGITVVGDYAFATCTAARSVSLPYTLTDMGIYCFAECTSLRKITLPASVDGVGDFAFYGCTALRSVRLEHGIETLGEGAFDGCTALREIDLPDSLVAMGSYCFFSCAKLKKAALSESLTEIPEACFAKCEALTDLYIPASVVRIADRAFNECAALQNISYGGSPDQYAAIEVGVSNEGLEKTK